MVQEMAHRVGRPICAELHGSGKGTGLIISVYFGF